MRLHLAGGSRISVKLLQPATADSTTLRYCRYPAPPCLPGSPRYGEVPLAIVHGLDLHRGTQWRLGAAVGAGIGVIAFLAGVQASGGCFPDSSGGEQVLACGAAGVMAMSAPAPLGALIGSHHHRWRALSWPGAT